MSLLHQFIYMRALYKAPEKEKQFHSLLERMFIAKLGNICFLGEICFHFTSNVCKEAINIRSRLHYREL